MVGRPRKSATTKSNSSVAATIATTYPHFFRIILDNTIKEKKLRLPVEFVKKYGNKLSTVAILTVPQGRVWKIGLAKDGSNIWFHNDWHRFVEYYSICTGDLLVFRYENNSRFHVLMFDHSTCEFRYPFNNVVGGGKLSCDEIDSKDDVKIIGSKDSKVLGDCTRKKPPMNCVGSKSDDESDETRRKKRKTHNMNHESTSKSHEVNKYQLVLHKEVHTTDRDPADNDEMGRKKHRTQEMNHESRQGERRSVNESQSVHSTDGPAENDNTDEIQRKKHKPQDMNYESRQGERESIIVNESQLVLLKDGRSTEDPAEDDNNDDMQRNKRKMEDMNHESRQEERKINGTNKYQLVLHKEGNSIEDPADNDNNNELQRKTCKTQDMNHESGQDKRECNELNKSQLVLHKEGHSTEDPADHGNSNVMQRKTSKMQDMNHESSQDKRECNEVNNFQLVSHKAGHSAHEDAENDNNKSVTSTAVTEVADEDSELLALLADMGICVSARFRNIAARERERAMKAARWFKPKNPSFMIILRQSDLSKVRVYAPGKFANTYMRRDVTLIKVQDSGGRAWPIRIRWRHQGGFIFSRGCSLFLHDKNFDVGDVCIFELVKDDALKVSILHSCIS